MTSLPDCVIVLSTSHTRRHYDHIAGGKPFKDLGATFVAHGNAKAQLEALKYPDVVIPDTTVGDLHVIELGGVRVELHYVGRNDSDNSLVMLVPKDKLIFTVDFVPIETVQFRDMPDGYLPDCPAIPMPAGDSARRTTCARRRPT